ncbi:MAG: hypothetical protein JSR63_05400 [Proteobacteria bacterium]|nr:hypothetical protein [Pseudomonadota bacterium]MBS0217599.1 hypothetical protein [Pseudomonadota bacterium]
MARNHLLMPTALIMFAGLTAGCVHAPTANVATAPALKLLEPLPGLYTAGQPDAGDWKAIHARGVQVVINLRPPGELKNRDESAEVRGAEMRYLEIPVAGADGINDSNARALHAALAPTHGNGVLVHCSSGNRAGALLALEQADFDGLPKEKALELGRKAGVTSLEARLRQLLDAGR